MKKTILLTGSTDGIGFEAAKILVGLGYTVLLHGRSQQKLADVKAVLSDIEGAGELETYQADLSSSEQVAAMSAAVIEHHTKLDVLINNAGVFKLPNALTPQGHDLRFVVNTIAPYDLTQRLLPIIPADGRVINLSSAAQAPVDLDALSGKKQLSDDQAYAQSKLAITMWSFQLAQILGEDGPAIIAVNPASFLASKMVKEAYGVDGNDLSIGAKILVQLALNAEHASDSGKYFDNDQRRFASPHPDALNTAKNERLVKMIETILAS